MRILVTGGSSFVGAHLCRLGAARHQMVAIYNRTPVDLEGVVALKCDLQRADAVERLRMQCADAVVHLAYRVKQPAKAQGIDISAENRRMLDVVLELGLPVVYASSTVVHWPQDSRYARGRREDEARVRESAAPWAIVRPCAPYGPKSAQHEPAHRESFHLLADLVRRLRIIPVIGNGRYRRQPVHVDDFNGAILSLLERGLPRQAFDAGGADALTFDGIVDTLARAMRRRVVKVHLPREAFVRLARFSRDFDPELIATVDSEDVADPAALARASGVRPRSFAEGVLCLV